MRMPQSFCAEPVEEKIARKRRRGIR
jgi:hypothetical protein